MPTGAEPDWERRYQEDSRTLGRLGQVLAQAELRTVAVRIPRALAEAARAAWDREEHAGPRDLTFEQRVRRHHAASLALIGASIANGSSRWDGDELVLELHPAFIGAAIDAADYLDH